MQPSESYRKDHVKLLEIVGVLAGHIKTEETTAANADNLAKELLRLAGALNVHLTKEDDFLYPKLAGHSNPEMAELAKKFQDEMGAIKEDFGGFQTRWATADAIKGNPGNFMTDINGIFSAVGDRIKREEAELYAKFDEVGNG